VIGDRHTNRRIEPWQLRRRLSRQLPLAAFAFVIVTLIALALAPGVLLNRLASAFGDLTTTTLPTYDRLRTLALAMERQAVAVRGAMLTDDERYYQQFETARTSVATTLDELAQLAPRMSPTTAVHLSALVELSALQHAHHVELLQAGEEAYEATIPLLDAVRDSVLLHLGGIERELFRYTEQRIEREARWASLQRGISFGLGSVAVLAVLLVGWSAAQQQRLRDDLEEALTEANTARAVADRRREELERVTESRARLMRGFGHDVKNPLGAADGYMQLLQDGILGPLTEQQLRGVERASRSITAGINLVEDLIELARAESGQLELALMPTDLRNVVRDAVEEYEAQAASKGLPLQVQLPEQMPLVRTDGRRVRQVLGNLISNAVKYTREGSVTVELNGAGGGRIGIAVSDTGPGIPAEQQHLLFEEFVRLDPGASRGAGIGLTISHRIAVALGGEIEVSSEVGQGSTFTLWLPADRGAGPSTTAA
jgi:signal transduction histidine kinase